MMEFGSQVDLSSLKSKSIAELQKLQDNEDNIFDFIQQMPEMTQVRQSRELLEATNRSLAEDNMSKEPTLVKLKQRLSHLCENITTFQTNIDKHQRQLGSSASETSVETMLAMLRSSETQLDEQSENIADEFIDGRLQLDRFIEDYNDKRTLWHLRHIRAEKLSQLMKKTPYLGSGSSTQLPVVPPNPPYPSPGYPAINNAQLPYPGTGMGPYSQPMPYSR